VVNAKITTCAIVFNDGNHGLTHDLTSESLDITMCMEDSLFKAGVEEKFIGQPQYRAIGSKDE